METAYCHITKQPVELCACNLCKDARFFSALEKFVEGCQRICDENQKGYSKITIDPNGKKYLRIVSEHGGSRSVHCFVHRDNGDVLKAAGWSAPAKHARGNIYDDKNGVGSMRWTGPAYLR